MFNLMVKPIRYILTHKQVILKVILLLLALGGIFVTTATYHDYINDVDITKSQDIQILTKEAVKLEQGKTFLWIFSKSDLSVIDIQEIDNYEITIDEETNGTSTFEVLKNTGASSGDIVCFKKDEDVLYWGIIDEITNENGGIKYTYQCKYITNIFNQKLPVPYNLNVNTLGLEFIMFQKYIQITFLRDTTYCLTPDDENNLVLSSNTHALNQYWYVDYRGSTEARGHPIYLRNVGTGQYLSSSGVVDSQLFLDSNAYTWYWNSIGHSSPETGEWFEDYLIDSSYKPIIIGLDDIGEGTIVKLGDEQLYRDTYRMVFKADASPIIYETGVEDFISEEIRRGWNGIGENVIMNQAIVTPNVITHTPKTIGLETDNGSYNLHTFMTNCTQHYNITYSFELYKTEYNQTRLRVNIENKEEEKKLIDVNAMNISDYQEVFTTNIVSKVFCSTKTYDYILFLKTDRTTTTDNRDPDIADGKTEVIYTDNYDEAPQECLNVIQKNQYNHNISFTYDKYIPVGTPIAIKTKNQAIENTYISSIKFSKNKFYQYECGNIRMNFIDKLLKERN